MWLLCCPLMILCVWPPQNPFTYFLTHSLILSQCSHARYESVMHTLYEQDQWMERFAGFGRCDDDYYTGEGEEASS